MERDNRSELNVFLFAKSPSIPKIDTILSQKLTTTLEDCLSSSSIELRSVQRLAPHVLRVCYSTTASYPLALPVLHQWRHLLDFETTYHVEALIQHLPTFSTPAPTIKLAVFDLDSTLIEQEVIDELARSIGALDTVAAITARAMAGELDFAESLKARVALLKGVRADVWDELKGKVTFANGARELCRALKRCGVKMAVLSGGFVPMADWVKEELGLDYAKANVLETSPATSAIPYPHLTGLLAPGHSIITAAAKASLTQSIAAENNIPLSETICVGDGANDLEMLSLVGSSGGWGVAFKAKETVQVLAPNRLNSKSLVDLIYLIGHDKIAFGELI